MSTSDLIHSLIAQPPSISLAALAPLALLDRTDHKFVLQPQQLHELLGAVLADYVVLQVEGVRQQRYLTTYFDTPDFALYLDHHNGKRSRYKLRCRTYLDSGVAFVEAKMKNNKERTVKYRRQVPAHVTRLDTLGDEWLPPTLPYPLAAMRAVVWNRFVRITLANFAQNERITIDTDIIFGSGEQCFNHAGLCIIEVKQPKFSLMRSPFTRQLHQMHLQPQAISKFCLAAAYFYPGCKTNQFKPLALQLHRSFPLRGSCECTA
jgi:hypothetical protein